jgi:hypothetical protein
VLWFFLFVDYVLNPEISILAKRIASGGRIFAQTAFVIERVADFEMVAFS